MEKTFFSLFNKVIELVNSSVYILISLAVLGFMWGIVKMLFNSQNEAARKDGRNFMLYGLLTLFVMTSVWGLVNLINGTIKVKTDDGASLDPTLYKKDASKIQKQDFPSVQENLEIRDDVLQIEPQ